MRKWFALVFLAVLLAFPGSVGAQNKVELATVYVQLWPEFDQPSMLVIYDFTFKPTTSLPADFSVQIPVDANLIAVAYEQDGTLLNVPFQEPLLDDNWQIVTLKVETDTTYHIEYYAPLTRTDQQRAYDFLWPGEYAVAVFSLRLKVPVDTTDVITDPPMEETVSEDGADTFMDWGADNLEEGQQIPVKITYIKTTERLSTSGASLQAGTVDENTLGRVSVSNYLPYILGGLGVFLILAGGFYFWQTVQGQSRPRRRPRSRGDSNMAEESYCNQCGKRAQPGDRFCRTCGTRLRREA